MGYIIKKGSGTGGGDATAVNQIKQIDQLSEGSGSSSVFKNVSDESVFIDKSTDSVFIASGSSVIKDDNFNSVFKDDTTNLSLLKTDAGASIEYRKNINTGIVLTSRSNGLQCQVFTAVTAAGAVSALNLFLATNGVIINSMTATQGAGSHDIYLLYSVL